MLPQIEFIGLSLSTYSLFALLGAILSGLLFCHFVRRQGLDSGDAVVFLFSVAAGAILGSHLLYAVVNIKNISFLSDVFNFTDTIKKLNFLFGGSVFYGGLLGGITFGYITIKIMHLDLTFYSDTIAPIIPFFHGTARIGCFFAGCCYGIESDFGFTAKNNIFIPEVEGISRFPVQLLESVFNFLISIFLFYLYKKNIPFLKCRLIIVYFILYSTTRFFNEFFRGDEARGFLFGLSTSQFISVILFIFSVSYLFCIYKKSSESS